MAKRAVNLSTGDHLVDVKCPDCGDVTTISVTLTPEHKSRPGTSSLRVVLSQEKSDHNCGQPALPDGDDDQPALSVVGTDEPDF